MRKHRTQQFTYNFFLLPFVVLSANGLAVAEPGDSSATETEGGDSTGSEAKAPAGTTAAELAVVGEVEVTL